MRYTTDLIQEVAGDLDLTNKEAKAVVQSTLRAIARTPADSTLSLRGFGKFRRYVKPERRAHNPSTGEPVMVPAKEVVRFNPSPRILEY